MNKDGPHIVFRDGKLFACVIPPYPRQMSMYMYPPGPSPVRQQWIEEKEKAIADALPVNNPDVAFVTSSNGVQCIRDGQLGSNNYYRPAAPGEIYKWPGTMELIGVTTTGAVAEEFRAYELIPPPEREYTWPPLEPLPEKGISVIPTSGYQPFINKAAKEYAEKQGTDYPISEEYQNMIRSQIREAFIAGWEYTSNLQADA